MKAIKNCYWKYLGNHKFENNLDSFERIELKQGTVGFYERKCIRCGLKQKLSCMMGLLFLEKEWGGK